MRFSEELVRALFLLAFIEVKGVYRLENQYWPNTPEYDDDRRASPWFLVKTDAGLVKIGWRKRVISITRKFEVTRLMCGMGWGIYGSPFFNATSGFPIEDMVDFLPEGSEIELTVRVVKVGTDRSVNPWEARDLYGYSYEKGEKRPVMAVEK